MDNFMPVYLKIQFEMDKSLKITFNRYKMYHNRYSLVAIKEV